MSRRSGIMLGVVVGSTLGGLIPSLWGDSAFSMWSLLLSAVGGFAGIWAAVQVF